MLLAGFGSPRSPRRAPRREYGSALARSTVEPFGSRGNDALAYDSVCARRGPGGVAGGGGDGVGRSGRFRRRPDGVAGDPRRARRPHLRRALGRVPVPGRALDGGGGVDLGAGGLAQGGGAGG